MPAPEFIEKPAKKQKKTDLPAVLKKGNLTNAEKDLINLLPENQVAGFVACTLVELPVHMKIRQYLAAYCAANRHNSDVRKTVSVWNHGTRFEKNS